MIEDFILLYLLTMRLFCIDNITGPGWREQILLQEHTISFTVCCRLVNSWTIIFCWTPEVYYKVCKADLIYYSCLKWGELKIYSYININTFEHLNHNIQTSFFSNVSMFLNTLWTACLTFNAYFSGVFEYLTTSTGDLFKLCFCLNCFFFCLTATYHRYYLSSHNGHSILCDFIMIGLLGRKISQSGVSTNIWHEWYSFLTMIF